jgi:hypothetical protein
MSHTENTAADELPVVIARFSDEAIAQLAAGLLDAEGVEPFVWTQMPSRGLGQREASLSVRQSEAEKAKTILRNSPARAFIVDQENAIT